MFRPPFLSLKIFSLLMNEIFSNSVSIATDLCYYILIIEK